MVSKSTDLIANERTIGSWTIPTIELTQAVRQPLCLSVVGYIGNSVPTSPTGRQRRNSWMVQVASEVKAARGNGPWDPGAKFAITIGFSFNINTGQHGYSALDVENFIKPVIDAVAAGLFCPPETEPKDITHWNYDDSNFNTLLIHRLPDADDPQAEGIVVCVGSTIR